jgi:hypothetical protein
MTTDQKEDKIFLLKLRIKRLKKDNQSLRIRLSTILKEPDELNLKELRKSQKLTLVQVEEATGISNGYLSQIESGKIKNPGYVTIFALFKLYYKL